MSQGLQAWFIPKLNELEADIARLRKLLADAMGLLEQMPIKHPQQGERREALLQRYVRLLEKDS